MSRPPAPDDDAGEVVASVGPLDGVVVLLRDFLHRSGALRVIALVDQAPGRPPAVVDCPRSAPVQVDLGERTVYLPHAIELQAGAPALPEIRRLAPFDVDAAAGTVASPVGGVQHLAEATRALARALGGRNVAFAQFATTDPTTPLSLTARSDDSEPLVVALGEQEFALEE